MIKLLRFFIKDTDSDELVSRAPSIAIMPQGQMPTFALGVVVTIMSFLAALALGSVGLIASSAQDWQGQVMREATIQIIPTDGIDIDETLQQAYDLMSSFAGVDEVHILDEAATQQLLEPWLGSEIGIDNLDLPRLVIVRFSDAIMPDLDLIRATIEQDIKGAYFDDHQLWMGRLFSMARTLIVASLAIFILVLTALSLSVVFATRATLLMQAEIIAVLHFLGADSRFVARQFDGHFLKLGLKGGGAGILLALAVFWLLEWNLGAVGTAEGNQLALLFGSFSLKISMLAALAGLVGFVAFLTMLTSRSTVIRQLHEIDRRQDGF